jgi:putative transcriptional regulator
LVGTVDSLTAHLLVAGPTLIDPNFARTVVLIAAHSEEGAMGVILNRPTETTVAEAASELADVVEAAEDELVYAGGPVQPQGVVVLAEFEDPEEAAALVLDDIGFLAADRDGIAPPSGTRRARVFAGHSGWGPGQLEAELERDDWIVEPVTREDIFEVDPAALWAAVLERKGGQFALVARMPLDPSMN